MPPRYFNRRDLKIMGDALYIAEEATGNYYRFSMAQWKRHMYEVRTQRALDEHDIDEKAFAVLKYGVRSPSDINLGWNMKDFFLICLQDHVILNAVYRDPKISLLPILIYIFTHELIHIVRFCNFLQRADLPQDKREKEEQVVHRTAFDVLKGIPVENMGYVLESYRDHWVSGI